MTGKDTKTRILIVDDDEGLRNLVKKAGENAGFEVLLVEDGEQGLEVAAKHKPALIVLDITMPKLNGRGVLKRLKKNRRLQKIPVIMYSARADQQDRIAAFQLGAEDYVDKPFDMTILMRKIERILEKAADG